MNKFVTYSTGMYLSNIFVTNI